MNKKEKIISDFSSLYYYNRRQTWQNTYWMGNRIFKFPTDMLIYQEIIFGLQPDVIIETGTDEGGSALFMANMCDIIFRGNIMTIDISSKKTKNRPTHPRIEYIHGSSVDAKIIEYVAGKINKDMVVLVILDSDHSKSHVLNEMNLYSKFVTVGSYLIVEDSAINGHPFRRDFGPGPMEAIDEFILSNKDFVIDSSREKFMLTNNPRGYLKKIK